MFDDWPIYGDDRNYFKGQLILWLAQEHKRHWPQDLVKRESHMPTLSQFSSFVFLLGEVNIYIYIYFGGAFDQNPMMPYFSIHSSIAPLDTSQNPPHTFSILVFLWVSCTVPKSIFSLFQIPRSQNLQVLLNMWRFTYIKHLEKGPILSLWALLGKRTHAPLWNALWVFTLCNVRSKYIRKIWGGLYVFGIVIDEKTTSTIFLNSHFMVFMHPFSLNRAAG